MTDQLVVQETSQSALVMPVVSPREMQQAMRLYEEMKQAILAPSDFQTAGKGRSFIKRSGWSKLAIAFGVSTELLPGYPKVTRDERGKPIHAEAKVRATAPNGRYAEGWGACSIDESRFGKEGGAQKPEHDLPATAETRARNRAYANLFGHGELSAEEVMDDGPERLSKADREQIGQQIGATMVALSEKSGHAPAAHFADLKRECRINVAPKNGKEQWNLWKDENYVAAREWCESHSPHVVEAEIVDSRALTLNDIHELVVRIHETTGEKVEIIADEIKVEAGVEPNDQGILPGEMDLDDTTLATIKEVAQARLNEISAG